MPKLNFILLFMFFTCSSTFSQTEKTDTSITEIPDTVGVGGVDWFAYPYIFYSPETSLAFGGGGIVYFKLSDRPKAKASSITPSFYYTVNGQYDITIIPEFFLSMIN